MPQSQPSMPHAISLEHLIALNDEIAALVRAGVPLEQGLAALADDMPGRLGKTAAALAERAAAGQSLPEVLSDESVGLPPAYRAVVTAGLKAGRLPAALESLARSVRRLAETRREVIAAAVYPLLVLILAWGLLAFFANQLAPRILVGFDRLEAPGRGMLSWLADCGRWAAYWGPVLPVVVVVFGGWWWYRWARGTLAEPRGVARLLDSVPWLGQALRCWRAATFVEILGLLVDNRVPLDEGILLAAGASGDQRCVIGARHMADVLQRGGRLDRNTPGCSGFPPLLLWLMAASKRKGTLAPALQHAAAMYRRRAQHQAGLASVFLPVLLTVALGGSVTLLYALTLFVPYVSILKALGGP